MIIDDTLKMISQQQYPERVDVVGRVMAQVTDRPYIGGGRNHERSLWVRRVCVVAAAALALVIVNTVVFNSYAYDEAGMGSMIAQVNDYSSWNTIESAADNPIEYLFEDSND